MNSENTNDITNRVSDLLHNIYVYKNIQGAESEDWLEDIKRDLTLLIKDVEIYTLQDAINILKR